MKKSTLTKILIGLTVLLAAAVVHIAFNVTGLLGAGGDLRWVNTGRGVSYALDSGAVFHSSGGNSFIITTREGVRSIAQTGETRWHYTMTMRQPLMVARGQYTAVSESERGRIIHVFDANERIFSQDFDSPVHTFSINRTGFLTAILQMDEGYSVHIFHRSDRDRALYSRFLYPGDHPGIIPVMAEVSEDGRYIAYGLLDVNNRLVSRVQFSHTYRGVAWGTDGIFFEMPFEDEFLLHMRKTSNNRLVVVTDAQIVVLTRGANNVVTTTAEIPLYNQILDIAFDESGRFAVALGAPLLNAVGAAAPGTVLIFDAAGTLTGTYETNRAVTPHLQMEHGTVIIGTGRNFTAVNPAGELVWEFIALHDARDFLFLENSDTVLIAGATRAEIWQRMRVRDAEDADFFGIQGQQR